MTKTVKIWKALMCVKLKRPSLGGILSCGHLTIWSLAYAAIPFWPESLSCHDTEFFLSVIYILAFPVSIINPLFRFSEPDAIDYFVGLSELMLYSFVFGHVLAYIIKRIAVKRYNLKKNAEQANPSS